MVWHRPVLQPSWRPYFAVASHVLAAALGGAATLAAVAVLRRVWP